MSLALLERRLERLEERKAPAKVHEIYDVVRENPDPLDLCKEAWPDVRLADYQVEICNSVDRNNVTCVVAGHQLGKDFISGFIATRFYLTEPEKTCRIVATSVDDRHLAIFLG